jgi:uncharacterized membrane protein YsdA (DUF1294 family)
MIGDPRPPGALAMPVIVAEAPAMSPLHLALLWLAVASVAALLAHAMDKRAAARGGRRVSERTLHLLALAGGWPGALFAMALLRHKTRKPSFLLVTVGIVLLHAAAGVAAWRRGWLDA